MIVNTLQFILKLLARLVLWKYRPIIIAITGNIGKTTTKEAIYAVLSQKFSCRRSQKSYNNPIGLPLTILGQETQGKSVFGWFLVFLRAALLIIFPSPYPKILILEMGADEPGGIKNLVSWAKPQIGVLTAIGEIPVHIEFFKDRDQLIEEKTNLVKALPKNGAAILNYDFEAVRQMKEQSPAPVIFYGFDQNADVFASDIILSHDIKSPGINFKLNYRGSMVPVRLTNALGSHQIYPLLAAAAVGIYFDMNLVEIAQALEKFEPPAGRMRLIKGIKNTLIIDDSYNASPTPVLAALDTLAQFKNGRKVAILGDMTELGPLTEKAHRQIGKRAGEFLDLLLAVGEQTEFLIDSAKAAGMSEQNIFHFQNADQAKKALQEKIGQGDIILIKGSQAMRLEKIVEETMAEPQKAKELLVRQDALWQNK